MKALSEAHVNVKNKPIESQVNEIIDQLGKILPIKIEIKRVKLLIPAIHTGKSYGVIKEFMVGEEWKSNGDLEAIACTSSPCLTNSAVMQRAAGPAPITNTSAQLSNFNFLTLGLYLLIV